MTDKAGKEDARGTSAAEIVSREGVCTLEEICVACKVEAGWVAELVEHGALDPIGQSPSEWRFTQISVVHLAKAKRLERDLGLNTPGIALALDLIDQIEDLRRRLRIYETTR